MPLPRPPGEFAALRQQVGSALPVYVGGQHAAPSASTTRYVTFVDSLDAFRAILRMRDTQPRQERVAIY
jgi:hypothetical protein